MKKVVGSIALVFVAAFCFFVGSSALPESSLGTGSTVASAKAVYWKYGKIWLWTSGVKSLGKQKIHGAGTSKYKATVYRVYLSKTDIKNRNATGMVVIGGLGGKGLATVAGIIGANLDEPKHGLRYDTQTINSKAGINWNFHAWH